MVAQPRSPAAAQSAPARIRGQQTSRAAALLGWTPLVWLALLLLLAGRWGLSPSEAVRGVAIVSITQVLPGTAIWRLVRPASRGWWVEDLSMGFALGCVLAIAVQAVAGSFGVPTLSLVAGPVVAIALLATPHTRAKVAQARTTPLPAWWWPATSVALLPLLVRAEAFFRTNPVAWTEGFTAPYLDVPFHLAITAELAHRGPQQIPTVLGEPLQYHWFSHAWAAQTGVAGDVALDVVLLRLVPALISVATITIVASCALRLSPWVQAGPLAAGLATWAGDIDLVAGAVPTGVLDHRSPSYGLSNVLLVALVLVVATRWGERGGGPPGVLVAVLAVAAVGTKGSSLPVVVGGIALAWLVAMVGRFPQRRVMSTDLALTAASLMVSVYVLFGGGSGQLHVDVVAAVAAANRTAGDLILEAGRSVPVVALAAGLGLLDGLGRGAGLLALRAVPGHRRDPVPWLLFGTGLAGVSAALLMHHPGTSQAYFLRNAAPALAIGSALGLAAYWAPRLRARHYRPLVMAVLTGATVLVVLQGILRGVGTSLTSVAIRVLAATLVVTGGWLLQRRRLEGRHEGALSAFIATVLCTVAVVPVVLERVPVSLPDPKPIVAHDARGVFSADQREAARWLRDHSATHDVVATNRHCGVLQFARCDSRRFYVAAYTERRVLVEGWAYTRSWATSTAPEGVGDAYRPFWDRSRLRVNDDFFTDPDRRGASQLWDLGVRWLFVDLTAEVDPAIDDFAAVRFQTPWARVLQLLPPE